METCVVRIYTEHCTTVSKESTSPFEILTSSECTKQMYSEEKKILFEIDSRINFYTAKQYAKKGNERFQLAGVRDIKLISFLPSFPLSLGSYCTIAFI